MLWYLNEILTKLESSRYPNQTSKKPKPDLLLKFWVIRNFLMPFKNKVCGTSLVAQWLRIRLPMQGTRVRALVREDPTCCGATKPMSHNYWACALEPASHNYWAHVPQLLKPMHLEPTLHNKRSPCSPQLEKARAQQRRPNAAKINLKKKQNTHLKNKNRVRKSILTDKSEMWTKIYVLN